MRRRRKWLDENEFRKALRRFISEITGLLRLREVEVIPISTSMLIEIWPLILEEHIYEADALQIQTCKYSGSNLLLIADDELGELPLPIGRGFLLQ
jgi:predicted nucleic acid-binding protein